MGKNENRLGDLEQYRFLIDLDDAIRPLLDPEEITQVAATLLGKYLGVNRCAYAYVEDELDSFTLTGNYIHGVCSVVGRYKSSSFGAEFLRLSRKGVPYVVEDAESDERVRDVLDSYRNLQIRAVVSVPVIKAGRFVAGMACHQATPRKWQDEEIKLISLVAHRCWESIERNRASLELRNNETRYRALVESIACIVWHTDPEGAMFREGDSWGGFTGQSFEEYKGWGWLQAIHPDDQAKLRSAWEGIARGEPCKDLIYRLRRKDGEYRKVVSRGVPLRAADGSVQEWIGSCTDITDQKKLETERQHFVSLVERSTQFVGMADLELRPFFLNQAGAQMVGLDSMEEALQNSVADFFFPEDRDFVLNEFFPAVLEKGHGELEIRFRHFKTGEAIWMVYSVYPLLDEEGRTIGHATVSRNITDRKRKDEALKESKQRAIQAAREAEEEARRLDAVLETVPLGIAYANPEGQILRVNTENRRIWGAHPISSAVEEYAEWKGWWADGADRQGQPVQSHEWALARALKGEETRGDIIEIEPFGSPGVRRTIFLRAAPVRDATGRVTGGVAAQMDISDRVKTERALRESEAKFRTMTEAMPQMVWSALPDGQNDYCNQHWYEFTGVPAEKLEGDGWAQVVHPDDLQKVRQSWSDRVATEESYEHEHRLRHHSGAYRWVLGRALPVRDEQGRVVRWMGTLTDIHDQKLGAEELKVANRRKDEFLAMLAHELRNPLAPISTAAQILKRPGIDERRIRQSSEIIARQVKHMTELVDDLLDVSRVTRGLVELEKQSVDIKSVVTHAIEQVRPLIEVRNHQLNLKMGSAHAYVRGDRTRLVQVVSNLLNNAAKYTPQGGEITVCVEVQQSQVRIDVADNGVGIELSLLPQVFELFTQAERTPDRSQGGLGLGLALVKSIMTLHGGQVEARSEGPGKGSTFTLLMNLLNEQEMSREVPVSRDTFTTTIRAVNLMIVDDNLDAATSLAALLEAEGHQVRVEGHPKSALTAALACPPEVFILDIGLPDMSGYELARQLRERPETAKAVFIALTGYGQSHDRVLAKTVGFDHHFVKPMDTELLSEILAQMP